MEMSSSAIETDAMVQIHNDLRGEFGRLVPELEEDGTQAVYLPGGRFAVTVRPSSPSTVTVRKIVAARVDYQRPGLANYLITDHGAWLFGRYERNGDGLAIEHTLTISSLDSDTIRNVVMAIHMTACEAEQTLTACNAIQIDDE